MKRKAIEYQVSGLKCDANGCEYRDDSIKLEDYKKYLNHPCPKCGANLLTEADLKATEAMVSMCDWVNSLGLPTGDKATFKVRMHMDGSGIPKPEIQKFKP